MLNAGSSSLKYQLVQPISGRVAAKGLVERIGQTGSPVPDYAAALAVARSEIDAAGIDLAAVDLRVIGHRVVHGGERFREPTLITAEVLRTIWDLVPLAPLHNPANAGLIAAALDRFPDIPQVAVFDTAFFADLPEVAAGYAIDRAVAAEHGIRRYGFHGISHQYISAAAAELAGRGRSEFRQIVLHLGNGASASAVAGGQAIDTSMGLTPLEGLVMGTRGGDIDPGVLIHLMRSGMDADALETLLARRSGMLGLAGAVDLRDVHAKIAAGDRAAAAALDLYCYRIRKYIGSYAAALGRLDMITFTAGVGENDAVVRELAAGGLEALGIVLDPERNRAKESGPRIISAAGSRVTVAVIPTNEELAIARQSVALVAPR